MYHDTFSAVELIFASEIVKLLMSAVLSTLSFQQDKIGAKLSPFHRLATLAFQGKKVIIVVLLYSFSNMIPFYSISRIGAPIYTVCLQLKILTTAAFSKFVLGKQISSAKWRALFLLVIGCILVASPIINQENNDEIAKSNHFQAVLGLLSVLLLCSISGFASVYLESVVKDQDDKLNIWDRNFQLAMYSVVVLAITNIAERNISYTNSNVENYGFGQGWNIRAVMLVLLQAVGGILVAATLKYADAVLKCFATAVAIIITSIIGYFFLGSDIDIFVALGMIVTVLSIFNYTLDTHHEMLIK
jgi:UDP-sugar transporter A1/2/3